MKILVADDSKTNLAILTGTLRRMGHEVMPAKNGQEAIELFLQHRPDLIILDVVMDGMDGFECARNIRLNNKEDWIPIIFLSASVDDESIVKGINAGGDDYLTKPCSEITLLAKVKAMERISDMHHKLVEMTKQLSELSSTDALTGLYNRMQFNRAIRERIAAATRHQRKFALLFMDLDKFKLINDNLGHHAGDLLLIEVARRLKSCLRLDDFLARFGGDEFTVILSDIKNYESAGIAAQKIIDVISSTYNLSGIEANIGISIGITCFPKDGDDHDILLQHADQAMYNVKKTGSNQFQYFTDDLWDSPPGS